jgi:hypothetical protein
VDAVRFISSSSSSSSECFERRLKSTAMWVQFVTCEKTGVRHGRGVETALYYGEQLYQNQLMYYGFALMGTGLMF